MIKGLFGFLLLLLPLLTHCTSSSRKSPPVSSVQIAKGIEVQSIANDGLDAEFFRRPSNKPQKAVILLGGSEGGKYWSRHETFIQELIDQGCCVLSLGYFGTGRLPGQLRSIPLEYFSKAFHWLSMRKEAVIPDDYALIGVSRGAELALLLGSRFREVKAVVAIAPSSVIFPGSPAGILDAIRGEHSAWSSGGRELAFVPVPYSWTTLKGMVTGKRTRMFENALAERLKHKDAAIPVEKVQGPILLISFTRDQIWPSTLMAGQIMQRLRDRGFQYQYKHSAYEAGHSEWQIPSCRKEILNYVREHFLPSSQNRLPLNSAQGIDSAIDHPSSEKGQGAPDIGR